MATIDFTEFSKYDDELIRVTLEGKANPNDLNSILTLRRQIQVLVDLVKGEDFEPWFVSATEAIINGFLRIVKSSVMPKANQEIHVLTVAFQYAIIFYEPDSSFPNIVVPLHVLENHARLRQLEKTSQHDFAINLKNELTTEVNTSTEQVKSFLKEANETLALLNKEAGKIGVQDYARIFEDQAAEHSRFFKKGIGKAQVWLLSAIVTFGILIYMFTLLDSIFTVKGSTAFTPEVIVHVVGRFLLISLVIFLVSFSFKQFRINMHLYTLNKHRANTLKSFEYLTRAPDKLDPGSYNAILMEVAKSIYEAGQTGYINVKDGQADMPSIIDLSKIITQPKTP
jgi:hypothetical protein